MADTGKAEVWLRGPLPDILPALQPIAHALLQAREELNEAMTGFPEELLWQRPVDMASVGFHLQHMAGVLDRLLTYARGETLSDLQLQYLAAEGKAMQQNGLTDVLLKQFNAQVDLAMAQIKQTEEKALFETRGVGRAQIPSNVMGLMVHAAEHTMRHLGQLLVTVKIVKAHLS